ncbi:MAG: MarR family winged helix-turn-helix transcriptional regulator [Candidatus Dormibacteria bacterium]
MGNSRSVDSEELGLPETLKERIGYRLKHVQARFQSIQRDALTPLELNGQLLAVLIVADSHAPELQQRIGERLNVDRTTMVALIDNLEVAGFVERRSDSRDRRGRYVHVTPKGKKAISEGLEASTLAESLFLAPLSPTERETFREMLAKLI